jgi:hypothetical protein
MYQQLWGYKVEQKLYLGVREQKKLNTTGLEYTIILTLMIILTTQQLLPIRSSQDKVRIFVFHKLAKRCFVNKEHLNQDGYQYRDLMSKPSILIQYTDNTWLYYI